MSDELDETYEVISFNEACEARDLIAPVPSPLDNWMRANGWEPLNNCAGYKRKRYVRSDGSMRPSHSAIVQAEPFEVPAPCARCGLRSHNGLKGSAAYERMLKHGCVACPVCDEFDCTKNHPEFM